MTVEAWTNAVGAVRPAGFRPLIASVLAALADLEPLPGDRRAVVVTSGGDECWLSPRKIAAVLAASERPPEIRIVGLGLDQEVVDRFGAIPTRNASSFSRTVVEATPRTVGSSSSAFSIGCASHTVSPWRLPTAAQFFSVKVLLTFSES